MSSMLSVMIVHQCLPPRGGSGLKYGRTGRKSGEHRVSLREEGVD